MEEGAGWEVNYRVSPGFCGQTGWEGFSPRVAYPAAALAEKKKKAPSSRAAPAGRDGGAEN
jgi:hypothetical protein